MNFDLTPEENKAIRSLKLIAQTWPKSLWLFSASGSLCVMKKKKDGTIAVLPCDTMDQDYCVDNIDIENDGGDF